MSLQSDLQAVVARLKTDCQLLHAIVHGDNETVVATQGGDVKTVAKAIHDMEESLQAGLADLGTTAEQLSAATSDAQAQAHAAQGHARRAETHAQALNLPADLRGQRGKLLAVNAAEDGYAPIPSKARFHGLRKEGAKLIAETSDGTFSEGMGSAGPFEASRFAVWLVSPPGLRFSVNENGHLLIEI